LLFWCDGLPSVLRSSEALILGRLGRAMEACCSKSGALSPSTCPELSFNSRASVLFIASSTTRYLCFSSSRATAASRCLDATCCRVPAASIRIRGGFAPSGSDPSPPLFPVRVYSLFEVFDLFLFWPATGAVFLLELRVESLVLLLVCTCCCFVSYFLLTAASASARAADRIATMASSLLAISCATRVAARSPARFISP